ncbi:hypothetical protein ACHAQE_006548 [Botrytis cinerea]
MAGSKNEAISASNISNISVTLREDAQVVMDHDHLLFDNNNDPNKSTIAVTNIKSTNDTQEDITHEKHATIEEPTINLQLTERSFVCPWRDTSSNFIPKHRPIDGDAIHQGLWCGGYYRKDIYGKYWVELERKSSYDTFTCFPRLPLELRRKIWLSALPGPRTVILRLTTNYYVDSVRREAQDSNPDFITAMLSFDDDLSADLSPESLRCTCRESSEVFLENYRRPRGVRPVDGGYHRPQGSRRAACVRGRSEGWIDFGVDTLVVENLEHIFTTLACLRSRPDFSAITSLALSETPVFGHDDDPWWSDTVRVLIEEQFPRLKYLSLIANHVNQTAGSRYSRGHFGSRTVVKATDATFTNGLKRAVQIERLTVSNIFRSQAEEILNSDQMDAALADPTKLEMQFLHEANMSYWENIDVTLAFMVYREKDGEVLTIDGIQPACETHRHFIFSPYPTSKMHIRWWGHEYVIPIDENGIVDSESWGTRELCNEHEIFNRCKSSPRPWKCGDNMVVSRGNCWFRYS